MDITRDLLCWGYSKFFEIIRFPREINGRELSIACFDENRPLPIELYPCTIAIPTTPRYKAGQGPVSSFDEDHGPVLTYKQAMTIPGIDRSTTWLVVGAYLNTSPVHVVVRCGNEVVSYTTEPWEIRLCSDANFMRSPELCRALIEYDRAHCEGRLHPRLIQRFDAEQGVIWRMDVCWKEPTPCGKRSLALEMLASDLHFHMLDDRGQPLACTPYFFEGQPSDPVTTDEPNRLLFSVAIPSGSYCFTATIDAPQGELPGGFFALNGLENHRAAGFTAYCLANAADDRFFYECWFERHRTDEFEYRRQQELYAGQSLAAQPFISIVVIADREQAALRSPTIETIRAQSYPSWELLLYDWAARDSSQEAVDEHDAYDCDLRLRHLTIPWRASRAQTLDEVVRQASGEWICFTMAGDRWEPDLLHCVVEAIVSNSETSVLYCDEDNIDPFGHYVNPVFKSQLNVDLLYATNAIGSLIVVKSSAIVRFGRFDEFASGAEIYDLALRALESECVFRHIPRVLCHRPMEDESAASSERARLTRWACMHALRRHLAERAIDAAVEAADFVEGWRVRYKLPDRKPLISIIIPTKDHADILRECVESLVNGLTYPAYEILIVENNSVEPETFRTYDALTATYDSVTIVRFEGSFNYPAIINFGVRHARGDLLLLLNNDTKLITPDALEEMAGYFQRPEVGVVGAKLYFRDHLVQHVGMLVGTYGAVCHVNQNFTRGRGGYRHLAVCPSNFSSVTGACQLTSRRVFDEVGGYEEALAVGFNDVDYCLKVQEAGYLVVMTPYAEWYHYEFTTRTREVTDSAQQARWESENAYMHRRWPREFTLGDPYLNPNLDKNNFYYNLPRP